MKKLLVAVILVIGVKSVSSWAYDYDAFEGPNYVHLKESQGDLSMDLKKILKDYPVFLYVSGCSLDNEALPAFQTMSKKYPKYKFVRISQYGATKDYMLETYGSFGAPKMYFIQDGKIVSTMPDYYEKVGGQNTFMGYARSLEEWLHALTPWTAQIEKTKNVIPVTSFNYKQVLSGDQAILLRIDYGWKYEKHMQALFKAARKYPHVRFLVFDNHFQDEKEIYWKYSTGYRRFSLVDENRVIKTFGPDPKNPDWEDKLMGWLEQNVPSQKKTAKKGISPGELKNIVFNNDHHKLATMDADEFQQLNKRHKVIKTVHVRQSFYLLANAISHTQISKDMARLLIEELYYENQGGIMKAIPNEVSRQKVYVPVLKRLISYQRDTELRDMLISLEQAYMQ